MPSCRCRSVVPSNAGLQTTVSRTAKDGGGAGVLFQQLGQAPFGLAVDSTNAYFTTIANGPGTLVDAVSLNGGGGSTVYNSTLPIWQMIPVGTGVGELAASGSLVFLVGYPANLNSTAAGCRCRRRPGQARVSKAFVQERQHRGASACPA